jgi:hypothetical protein
MTCAGRWRWGQGRGRGRSPRARCEVRPLGWRKGKGGSRVRQEAYVFAKEVCAGCPLKESCFKQSEERNWGRVVYRHPQEALLQGASQLLQPSWRMGVVPRPRFELGTP